MPIFPDHDSGPDEPIWRFFRIEKLPNSNIEFETLSCGGILSSSKYLSKVDNNNPVPRGSSRSARIRDTHAGGFYPHVYPALDRLRTVVDKYALWPTPQRPLIAPLKIPVKTLSLRNHYYSTIRTFCPFVLTPEDYKHRPELSAALGQLFRALHSDAERALVAWSHFTHPINFDFRDRAIEELRAMMGQPKRSPLACMTAANKRGSPRSPA